MGDMADHIEWAELPDESVHEPTSDNPSPSKGLIKATQPDIDTQIESLLQPYHSDDSFICDTIDDKPCNCSVKDTHKAIKTLLIQSKSIDVGALFDICDEFATVQAENGEDYMMKWFYRNQDRFLAKLKEEL